MGDNAPSAEQVANLEKEQREAELQQEFAEFDRQENERKRTQKEYDARRAQIESEYSAQQKTEPATKKTFTGIRTIDNYLDKADTAAEIKASGKRIREESEIRKQEAAGQISPEYASFRRGKISETYEKQKVSDARIVIGGATKYAEGAVKGASGYLDNAPSRSTGMGGRSGGRRKPQARSFKSGIHSDVQFPSFSGTSQPNGLGQQQRNKSTSISFPGLSVDMPKRTSKPGFPSGLAQGTSMFGSKVTKSEGIKLNIGSPFGSKKTSPLKKGTKKKSLW